MDDLIINIIVIILVVLVGYLIYTRIINNWSEYVKSDIDNEYYLVRNTKNSKLSANMLAEINKNIKILFTYLSRYYNSDVRVAKILKNYNPNRLSENISQIGTSYTQNKGELVALCMASRDTNEKLYQLNTMMFVVIHELAHIGNEAYGEESHNKDFVILFAFLLKCAMNCGVYSYIDYSKKPEEYCGITINTTPIAN